MAPRRADELLYDSEATLRLVDNELVELRGQSSPSSCQPDDNTDAYIVKAPSAIAALPRMLQRANAEINNMLQTLRQSRSALEQSTVQKLQATHSKLREVTSATEDAATSILDALDRTQGLLDALDTEDAGKSERSVSLRAAMRDELFDMMGKLQFQDITSQQLAYASSILTDMETRLAQIAVIFDLSDLGMEPLPPEPLSGPVAFDPHASTKNADERQKVADELFSSACEPDKGDA
jgi:chemotaxis regulatin CheY-phosphate phosphatase CheZ